MTSHLINKWHSFYHDKLHNSALTFKPMCLFFFFSKKHQTGLCNSVSWSAVLTVTPALAHQLHLQKEQQCRWRPAGNLSESYCPGVVVTLQRVSSTLSSNIHHPPPLGRWEAGRFSGKATLDKQNPRSPAGVGWRRDREWKDGGSSGTTDCREEETVDFP